jgi:hypothetical protein
MSLRKKAQRPGSCFVTLASFPLNHLSAFPFIRLSAYPFILNHNLQFFSSGQNALTKKTILAKLTF